MLRKPTTMGEPCTSDHGEDGGFREGWLLKVELDGGAVGWGEVGNHGYCSPRRLPHIKT